MDEVDFGPERRAQRRSRPGGDPLEDRLDRLVNRGRQLVDGVAGARPGSRSMGREGERRPAGRAGFDSLGRWVENKLEWLLDEGDDWREPWQEGERLPQVTPPPRTRRPLEAISRRGRIDPPAPLTPEPGDPGDPSSDPGPEPDDWPEDSSFSVPRWQRVPQAPLRSSQPPSPAPPAGRPLPRSTRRRS